MFNFKKINLKNYEVTVLYTINEEKLHNLAETMVTNLDSNALRCFNLRLFSASFTTSSKLPATINSK